MFFSDVVAGGPTYAYLKSNYKSTHGKTADEQKISDYTRRSSHGDQGKIFIAMIFLLTFTIIISWSIRNCYIRNYMFCFCRLFSKFLHWRFTNCSEYFCHEISTELCLHIFNTLRIISGISNSINLQNYYY